MQIAIMCLIDIIPSGFLLFSSSHRLTVKLRRPLWEGSDSPWMILSSQILTVLFFLVDCTDWEGGIGAGVRCGFYFSPWIPPSIIMLGFLTGFLLWLTALCKFFFFLHFDGQSFRLLAMFISKKE